MARYKHWGFTSIAVAASCAPLNGVGPKSEAAMQSQTLAPVGEVSNPWAGKSGRAEALADLAAGRPIKLYTHVFAGDRAKFRTPGLLNCDLDQSAKGAEWLFAPLRDGDWSASILYTSAERSRQLAAFAFAKAYNLTIFEHKRELIVRLCPMIEVDKS